MEFYLIYANLLHSNNLKGDSLRISGILIHLVPTFQVLCSPTFHLPQPSQFPVFVYSSPHLSANGQEYKASLVNGMPIKFTEVIRVSKVNKNYDDKYCKNVEQLRTLIACYHDYKIIHPF